MDFIKSLGIDIEEFGMNSFIVKAHPTWFKEGLEEVFIKNCLEKIITMNKNFDLERFNDSISAMMACKASIKAGDPISMEEMKTLIERLKKCEEVLLYLDRKIQNKESKIDSLIYIKDLDTVTMKVNGKEIVFYCDTTKYLDAFFELVERAADKRPEPLIAKNFEIVKK